MRRIIAYKEYFSDFIKKLSKDEINKIRRALDLFKVNAARKSKVDDNTAKMQSIKQLGV